jgi:hypothetical protein
LPATPKHVRACPISNVDGRDINIQYGPALARGDMLSNLHHFTNNFPEPENITQEFITFSLYLRMFEEDTVAPG